MVCFFRHGNHFDLMSAIQQHVFKAAEIRKAPAKLQNHVVVHSGTEFVCQCDTLKITYKIAFWSF